MVQLSMVLSPATFRVRPLKGTSIEAMFDAGNCAALHKKDSSSAPFHSKLGVEAVAAPGNDGIDTSNRFGLAPPPSSVDLKAERVRKFDSFRNPPLFYDYDQTLPATSWKLAPVRVATKVSVMKLIDLAGFRKMSALNSLLSITSGVLLVSSQITRKSISPLFA